MAENFAGKYATDTMVTTETYSDPRAKEAASDFNDILYVAGTTTCQYSRTLSTYTEYGTYTRETVQEAFCPCPLTKASAAAQESPSSWKRKLSFTSLFRRRSSEKRPVDLMEPSPSPQPSPASNKTFFSAIQFRRPTEFVEHEASHLSPGCRLECGFGIQGSHVEGMNAATSAGVKLRRFDGQEELTVSYHGLLIFQEVYHPSTDEDKIDDLSMQDRSLI
jgi:hypothetical protein